MGRLRPIIPQSFFPSLHLPALAGANYSLYFIFAMMGCVRPIIPHKISFHVLPNPSYNSRPV